MLRAIGLVVLAAAVAFFASLWIEHHTQVTLPAPTGPFAVGRAVFDWKDSQHEVLAWMWYPAEADTGVPADYPLPPYRGLWRLLTRPPSNVRCHSLRNARLSSREQSYPVLIMRGGASAPVMAYSTLAEDLASHGYMIVGFDAPTRTNVVAFPDGRVIQRSAENNPELALDSPDRLLHAWTADIGFVLDTLQQDPHADLTRAGVFGHSFGGAQALQFCHDDSRCKAVVDVDGAPIDGVIRTGVGKPLLFVLSDHTGEEGSKEIMANINSMHGRVVTLPRSNHFMFSDDGALLKSWIFRAILRVDGRRQLALTAQYLRDFFDAQLRPIRVRADRGLTGAHHTSAAAAGQSEQA